MSPPRPPISAAPDAEPWAHCLERLRESLPDTEFTTYIQPLQAEVTREGLLVLFAPNQFVLEQVRQNYIGYLTEVLQNNKPKIRVDLRIGSRAATASRKSDSNSHPNPARERNPAGVVDERNEAGRHFTFDNHVEGESNKIARAACLWAARNPGSRGYNPLYICGASGLGKTHLMHAVRNLIQADQPQARVAYVRSVDFVSGMVQAIRGGRAETFQRHYRSLDALLIDDIQFLADKEQSQNEFFNTFNELFDGQKQIVVTSDRLPMEFATSTNGDTGIQKRLVTRLGSGLTASVTPPELETRVAILKKKAASLSFNIGDDVAFFVAHNIQSNVRDLEGALHNIRAWVNLTDTAINIDTARAALTGQLGVRARQVTVENILKVVAEYYSIRSSVLQSRGRTQKVARPRQIAMALARELTNESLPNIGKAFGGRDHTTVIHACRRIKALCQTEAKLREDYENLRKTLQG